MEKIETQWGEYKLKPHSHALNRSLGQDARLWQEEKTASLAWARALMRAGVLSAREFEGISQAVEGLKPPDPDGPWEDVHAWLEQGITRKTEAGLKLHTGRSRNEQVVLDEMLWLRKALKQLKHHIAQLIQEGISLAHRSEDLVVPGRTHGQPAQALAAGHLIMAHLWPFIRDIGLADAMRELFADACPLGSGALAGSFVPVDRWLIAQELGFSCPTHNSLDAVSSRDYATGFLFLLSQTSAHLSRLAGEWIAGVSQGWLSLGSGVSTSSSLMPHKRNPDVAELIRAEARLVISDLSSALNLSVGLESGYHKDFQVLKKLMFRSYDRVVACLSAGAEMMQETVFHQITLHGSMSSVSRIKQLVQQGTSFRQAYFKVKEESEHRQNWPEPASTVWDHDVFGGTHPERVKEQLRILAKTLEEVL